MRINVAEGNLDKQSLFIVQGQESDNKSDNKSKESGRNIYAGNMNLELDLASKIKQKREQAQNQAVKLITEAFVRDTKYAENVDKLKQLHSDKVSETIENQNKINELENNKEELRKKYGVDKDSQEQKDLELLQKYQNAVAGYKKETFSEEEIDRLKELQNIPTTEYQKRVLEMNAAQGVAGKLIEDAEYQTRLISQSITDANIEQLKSQDMLKSKDAADDILDAVEQEIAGMVTEAAKENIDKTAEEEQEKAEKVAEEKEERDEQIQEQKEERKEQEELLSEIADGNKLEQQINNSDSGVDSVKIAQLHIKNIIQDNNLIDEDLKGIEIDLSF